MTIATVWLFMREGCNAAEIAEFSGMSISTVRAMCASALRQAHNGKDITT